MTIHTDHPFAEPDDPLRRFRGRVGGTVAVACAGRDGEWAGLTVTSFLVANGAPPHVLVMVDPDSDLADVVKETGRLTLSLLEWEHRDLAEAFAGRMPAPGGVFTLGAWEQSAWGPVLSGASAWVGLSVVETGPVGWSLLVDAEVDEVQVGDSVAPLVHRRGRYERPS